MRALTSAVTLCLILGSAPVYGQTPVPVKDLPGSADSALVGRFQGSVIVSYEQKSYDEFMLPLSRLEQAPGKKDAKGAPAYEPKKRKELEGRYTHAVYVLPAGRSALEALRNYQEDVKNRGGEILYECRDADCAPEPGGNVLGQVGSLARFLYPPDRATDEFRSPGYCTMEAGISDVRFFAAELPGKGHLAFLAYISPAPVSGSCREFSGRTIVAVNILESAVREQKMVTVNATEMAQAISSGGKVALYGIYFQSGNAAVESRSDTTLEQIARLLESQPGLKLLVVGHTDSTGTFTSNLDLSQRRAAAVVAALVGRYGVARNRLTPFGASSAAPVASNQSDEGRAKNRRVELVPN